MTTHTWWSGNISQSKEHSSMRRAIKSEPPTEYQLNSNVAPRRTNEIEVGAVIVVGVIN